MVVHGHGELLLGLVLADDVLIEERANFLRLGQVNRCSGGGGFGAVVLEDRVAHGDALIADVGARIVRRRADQLRNRVL